MKHLLPDTLAARAMMLLISGLAVTHLLSNLFYATDRDDAFLAAGGEQAVQWVATVGALARTLPKDESALIVTAVPDGVGYATLTNMPVIAASTSGDWRLKALRGELDSRISPDQDFLYRIAYASGESETAGLTYWRSFFDKAGVAPPPRLVLISFQTGAESWINFAAPVRPYSRFLSWPLALSLIAMLIAVTLLAAVFVRGITKPLTLMSRAAEKLGTDVRAPAIPESGPDEVRRAARAFNVMQQRIRRFVDDRTEMLGAIAHDLGTPITRLRLRAEFSEDPELRQKMLRDLDDMQHMVASTLAFIREDATSESVTSVDIASLVARVCDDIQDTGVEVLLSETPQRLVLECHPVALRRAIGNLIENAAKYGARARVSLQLENDVVHICVDDDGPGIPADRQEDVFLPFRRLDRSRNLQIVGSGLGLAVARSIARARGGDIRLENRPQGGLRAILSLPGIRETCVSVKPDVTAGAEQAVTAVARPVRIRTGAGEADAHFEKSGQGAVKPPPGPPGKWAVN